MRKNMIKAAFAASAVVLASQAMAQVVLYEHRGFHGRSVVADGPVRNVERRALGDTAASAVVEHGRWEVCEEPRFGGRCAILRRGNYPNLRASGLDWEIASVRPARAARRDELTPQASAGDDYRWRRRASEHTREVPIRDVRAIMGPPGQQCWVERQAVPAASNGNVGGAVAGAIIGGILGHQVGAGSGRDAATGVGAIAGAAIGNQMGNNGAPGYATQDVQRCQAVQGNPAYYEVTYNWHGARHTVQMTQPPAGNTIVVNEQGEPRM